MGSKFVSRRIPIILMTGFSEILETKSAYLIGASEFLAKPFKKEDLSRAILKCLEPEVPEHQESSSIQLYCKLGINVFIKLTEPKYVGFSISLAKVVRKSNGSNSFVIN